MSEWRDARLQRALQEAPDVDMLPAASTRRAVLAQAHDAIAPARAAPWWQRLWQGTGSRQMPWNAAFATVVVATLVTVLWHDREVPDARTENAVADRQAPAPAASAAAPAPVTAPPAAQSPAEPVAQPPAAAAKPRATAPPPAPVPQAAPRRDDIPEKKQQAPELARERRAETAVGALRGDQGGALSKSAPRDAEPTGQAGRAAAESAPAQAPPAAQSAAAPPPAPAAAAAPVAPPAPAATAPPARAAAAAPQAKSEGPQFAPPAPAGAAAPAAGLSARDAASSGPAADTLLLAGEGRSAQLPASQAARLLGLVSRMGREAQGTEPLREPVTLRIELRRQGQLVGVLEVAGPQVRWTVGRGVEARSATAQPDDAQLQALRDEFRRLIER